MTGSSTPRGDVTVHGAEDVVLGERRSIEVGAAANLRGVGAQRDQRGAPSVATTAHLLVRLCPEGSTIEADIEATTGIDVVAVGRGPLRLGGLGHS